MINITLNVSFLLLNFTIIVFNYYFSLNLQLFDLNNIYNKFSLEELKESPFYFICKNCGDIPEIILKDNKNIIITCQNCNITKDEKLENISNYSSEWITNEIINFCDYDSNHKEKTISLKFCKECNKFLCENCLKIHKKNISAHKLVKTKYLKIGFCNIHYKRFIYYCKVCNLELCRKCKNIHKGHYLIELAEKGVDGILKLFEFERFLEKAEKVKKEKYLIINQIKTILDNTFTNDKKSTLVNNIIYDIVDEFYKDLKIGGNLVFFSKILFVTLIKLNKWEDSRVKQIKQILDIINKYFDKE